jgi:putative component of membrane protein insertase Oxa1/YidC/SpoIIIJ protein YidD
MALNTIDYMLDKGDTDEADRILARIGGCNGLCKGYYDPLPDHDCGCGGQNRKE